MEHFIYSKTFSDHYKTEDKHIEFKYSLEQSEKSLNELLKNNNIEMTIRYSEKDRWKLKIKDAQNNEFTLFNSYEINQKQLEDYLKNVATVFIKLSKR